MHTRAWAWPVLAGESSGHGTQTGAPTKETIMKRLTTAGLLATCSAALLIGAPMAANAVPGDRPAAVSAQAVRTAPAPATLVFEGGVLDGSDLRAVGSHRIDGTTTGSGNFTQDDGWNQETQQWTGGNELTLANDYMEFSIGDLTIAGGAVTGHLIGQDLPWWMEDLTGPLTTTATASGDRLTVTAYDSDSVIMELRFALAR